MRDSKARFISIELRVRNQDGTDDQTLLYHSTGTGLRVSLGDIQKYNEYINTSFEVTNPPYTVKDQQIVGDGRFIEKIAGKAGRDDLRGKKQPLRPLMGIVEKMTGISHSEMTSRRRDKRLRMAKGVLVVLGRKAGNTIVELQKVLKRDDTVISRMSEIVRTAEGENTFRKTKGGLIAYLPDPKRAHAKRAQRRSRVRRRQLHKERRKNT